MAEAAPQKKITKAIVKGDKAREKQIVEAKKLKQERSRKIKKSVEKIEAKKKITQNIGKKEVKKTTLTTKKK